MTPRSRSNATLASPNNSNDMDENTTTDSTNISTATTVNPSTTSNQDALPSHAEPLGRPLPLDEHACSVSLPTWSSVVGYEEGMPEVTSRMSCGYPRFVYHPYIITLMDYAVEQYGRGTGKDDCLVLPTMAAAKRCQSFLQQTLSNRREGLVDNALIDNDTDLEANQDDLTTTSSTSSSSSNSMIRTVRLTDQVAAVLFPAETLAGMEAKAYWQHTGEVVSSRRAEVALCELGLDIQTVTVPFVEQEEQQENTNNNNNHTESSSTVSSAKTPALICHTAQEDCRTVFPKLQGRIANLTGVPTENVHLTGSGMSSIYMALRASRRWKMQQGVPNGGASIVYGFPYLDTLKLCSRKEFCPGGVEFFGHGNDRDLNKLDQMLLHRPSEDWCALFTEIPSNPLLLTPDFKKLRELASQHRFALVVDDTIGNFLNVDLLGPNGADVICTSLTKLFSGRGDAMAGSVVINHETEAGRAIQQDIAERQQQQQQVNNDNNAMGSNDTGLFAADAWAVHHNSLDFEERNDRINGTAEELADWLRDQPEIDTVYYPKYTSLYSQVATGRGYGGLLSLLLQSHVCQRTFYDALDVAKGPSLGTNFTLMCPYTLLAHYHELDFAMTYNVQPNLLRLAVGLEDVGVLQQKFENAFNASRLHPPLPRQTRMYHTDAAGKREGLARHGSVAAAMSRSRTMMASRQLVGTGLLWAKRVL